MAKNGVKSGRTNSNSTVKTKKTKKGAKKGARPASPAPNISEPTAPVQLPSTDMVPAAPGARDARLPSAGTTLIKRDRSGLPRCECVVEAGGYTYNGNLYRSLTAAARAAATDLGITPAVNGLVFWGVVRANRAGLKPTERLRKASARYEQQAEAVCREGTSDGEREEMRRELEIHASTVGKLLAELAA